MNVNTREVSNVEKNWMELLSSETQVEKLMQTNGVSEKYGLVLTKDDALALTDEKKYALKEQRRVEFGVGILPKLIQEFCDSSYIMQDNYVKTLAELQNIFYLYKNEMQDEITDDELIHFMREQFETVCFGDLEYLSGTCLAIFAEAIRAGYRSYTETDGYGAYQKLDPTLRWDYELFTQALMDLFG